MQKRSGSLFFALPRVQKSAVNSLCSRPVGDAAPLGVRELVPELSEPKVEPGREGPDRLAQPERQAPGSLPSQRD
jgi:hypothetical protein